MIISHFELTGIKRESFPGWVGK